MADLQFNPPPGWPKPPSGWRPPSGWAPDPGWPAPPPDWEFWIPVEDPSASQSITPSPESATPAKHAAPILARPVVEVEHSEAEPTGETVRETERRSTIIREYEERLESLRKEETRLREEYERKRAELESELIQLDDSVVLQQVGIYRYHHPLESAAAYRERLGALSEQIKALVKSGKAVLASDMFSYNNSLALGRRMTSDLSKLVLRAYNAEADNALRSLRAGNLATAQQRISSSSATIERLGAMMELRIAPEYHALRIQELELYADFLVKQQEERERAREERERLREERKAEEELLRERERLHKERSHYVNALEVVRAQGKTVEAESLQQHLAEIDQAISQNDYRVANIRAGYVYVISNVGAFGANVVKIGLTRRLEPEDRIRELGDASVPFPFDIHAIYFADDAVSLEGELHEAFSAMRLNHVNPRREFFFATPQQVRDVLMAKVGNLLEFTDEPEATQYFQSRGLWPPPDTLDI